MHIRIDVHHVSVQIPNSIRTISQNPNHKTVLNEHWTVSTFGNARMCHKAIIESRVFK